MSRFLLAATAAALVACTQPAPEQAAAPPAPPDTAALRVTLVAMSEQLKTAYLAGDAAAVASHFTDDARAEYAGFPSAVGRAAIQSTYDTYFKANKLTAAEWTFGDVAALSADLATAGGTYHAYAPEAKPAHAWWRWAAAYRKGADGQYRLWYSIAFPDSTK